MEPLILTETIKCNNCGCDSHCGTKFKRTEKGYQAEGSNEYEIEVCGQCRCEACK